MGFRCSSIVAFALTIISAADLGCRREQAEPAKGGFVRSAVAPSSASATAPDAGKPSVDLLASRKMQNLLDAGDRNGALALARTLMDSPEQKVRLVAIDAMGWMGKVAFPELVELMAHPDEVTSEAALCAWGQGFGEIQNDALRIAEIFKAVKAQKRKRMMDVLLDHLGECDEKKSVIALGKFIQETTGQGCNPSAKEAYAFMTGEDWVSSVRTEKWVSNRK